MGDDAYTSATTDYGSTAPSFHGQQSSAGGTHAPAADAGATYAALSRIPIVEPGSAANGKTRDVTRFANSTFVAWVFRYGELNNCLLSLIAALDVARRLGRVLVIPDALPDAPTFDVVQFDESLPQHVDYLTYEQLRRLLAAQGNALHEGTTAVELSSETGKLAMFDARRLGMSESHVRQGFVGDFLWPRVDRSSLPPGNDDGRDARTRAERAILGGAWSRLGSRPERLLHFDELLHPAVYGRYLLLSPFTPLVRLHRRFYAAADAFLAQMVGAGKPYVAVHVRTGDKYRHSLPQAPDLAERVLVNVVNVMEDFGLNPHAGPVAEPLLERDDDAWAAATARAAAAAERGSGDDRSEYGSGAVRNGAASKGDHNWMDDTSETTHGSDTTGGGWAPRLGYGNGAVLTPTEGRPVPAVFLATDFERPGYVDALAAHLLEYGVTVVTTADVETFAARQKPPIAPVVALDEVLCIKADYFLGARDSSLSMWVRTARATQEPKRPDWASSLYIRDGAARTTELGDNVDCATHRCMPAPEPFVTT